jgi:hypothetical protein
MYLYTVNAFPYGPFKNRVVMEDVYEPDWTSDERVNYTIAIAHLLAELSPAHISPSIQTAPLAFAPRVKGEAYVESFTHNVLKVVAALWRLEQDTGRRVKLALEPEPVEPSSQPLFAALGLAERLGARHHIGDIRDPAALAVAVAASRPEVVLHLAAQPLVRRSYRDPLGTWAINVQGSLNLLEALKPLQHSCAVVMVTTDKVYANQEWPWGYRESDPLGGHDPYSASKAGAEIAIASWRASFIPTRSIPASAPTLRWALRYD